MSGLQDWGIILLYYTRSPSSLKTRKGFGNRAALQRSDRARGF